MAAILPGFEYDIFISYRHNDNRSGGITNFVNHLKEELAATLKTPLSIYFDTNAYDGLMENHDVDKSLAIKLNSLIFIPVISQTYCDTSSFAWQHEFCVFNKLAKASDLGRDIKLNSGNVASRILPVKIHDLEQEDREIIESEIDGVLRSIEFIFKSAGVNRPLQIDDKREDNLNRLFYRDQINKVANAIKDIINGIRYPDRVQSPRAGGSTLEEAGQERAEVQEVNKNSIAVLPFRNLAHDPSQEYFADGITENILMELSSLQMLKVISRTSVMRYKNTEKSAPEIATELGVKYILEGSAQAHGNKVRINAQLIDAQEDDTIWSKVFVESLDDIFEIQNNVSEVVSKELQGSLNPKEAEVKKEVPTKDTKAYDLFLKGRHAFNQWGVEGYKAASEYFKQAIALDPEFKLAYSFMASSYSARMSWNGDLNPAEAKEKIEFYLGEAWQRGPSENDYLTKAFLEFFITKDFEASEGFLKEAMTMNTNNSIVLYTYSYLLNMMGRFDEAVQMVEKAKVIDPMTVAYYNYQTINLYFQEEYDQALETLNEALRLYPAVLRLYDFLGRVYLTTGDYKNTEKAIETGLATAKIRPPSMLAYLAVAQIGLDKNAQAQTILDELIGRSEAGEKGVNIYLVYIYNALGDTDSANNWLTKAKETNDVDLIWLNVDPLLKNLHEGATSESTHPDYDGAEKYVLALLEEKLPPLDYHNMEHIQDVLQSALVIAENENISQEEVRLLRLAVLFHDVGFIHQASGHEIKSAEIAAEVLPKYGLSEAQISTISSMILATRIPQSPTNQLDKILCDADLDYLGRDDFNEMGIGLYKELLSQGIVETEREWNLVQKTFFESHHYHTEYSKKQRAPAKAAHLKAIMMKLQKKN
jgi:TolB-like protein/predicted metal-dependent HD superfamily phosphohydrolase/Tfp pilus assembly protein PilF